MKNGGYTIADFKGKPLTANNSTETHIDDLYETIEGNYRKRIVVSGLVIGTTEYPDFEAVPYLASTTFKIPIPGGYVVSVPSDNDCTCKVNEVAYAAGDNPTKAEYKTLVDALIAANIIQLDT